MSLRTISRTRWEEGNLKDELISLLETLGYPVRLQGSFAEDEQYPESFFTFWNNDSTDGSHYDNDAVNYVWDFDVNFYSIDPALVNTVLLDAKRLMKSNGWIVSGKGHDLASDEPTHTGRGINVIYIER